MLQLSSQKTTAQGENLVPVGLCKELFPLKGSKRRREDSSVCFTDEETEANVLKLLDKSHSASHEPILTLSWCPVLSVDQCLVSAILVSNFPSNFYQTDHTCPKCPSLSSPIKPFMQQIVFCKRKKKSGE
ncbi:uncharacterized protein ACOB8E_005571 isoform 1-T1 [Sarcophilus harrisii]